MKPRPFRLPKTVQITSKVKYLVILVDAFDDPLQLGECCPATKTISLLKKLKGKKLEETFAHEILHAMNQANKIPLADEWEETLVCMLERPFAQFLRLNNLRYNK